MFNHCRPPLEAHFHAAYFAKCHNSIRPLVNSWMAAGNQSSGIEEQ